MTDKAYDSSNVFEKAMMNINDVYCNVEASPEELNSSLKQRRGMKHRKRVLWRLNHVGAYVTLRWLTSRGSCNA